MNENILLWDVGHYYFSSNALWRAYKNIPGTEYAPHVYVTSVKPTRYKDINLNSAEKQTWFRQIKVDGHLGKSFIRTIYTPDINDVINLENGKLLPSGSDTGWQRVCTTNVADVDKTTITTTIPSGIVADSGGVYVEYAVKNGWCNAVYMFNIASSTIIPWTKIATGLPKPAVSNVNAILINEGGEFKRIATRIKTDENLYLTINDTISEAGWWMGAVTYPVAKS